MKEYIKKLIERLEEEILTCQNAYYEKAEIDYMAGMKYKDIAEKYGTTINTVKSWKKRYDWNRKEGAPKNKKVCTQNKAKVEVAPVQPEDGTKETLLNEELSPEQQMFCIYYSRTFNATQSYLKAYGCSYETAMVEGCKALRNPKIKREIERLKEIKRQQIIAGEEDIVELQMRIAFSDIGDYLSFRQESVPVMAMFGPVMVENEETGEKEPLMQDVNATGYSADGSHENDPVGLDGYNCRHNRYVWFEGISNFPPEDPEPEPVTINGKTYDYYAITQKQRSMERSIRGLKREREALKALNMDTKEISTRIKQKIREYEEFSDAAGVDEKHNRLRYECGTSNLKKTKAWKAYQLEADRKKIDFGRIKDVKFENTVRRAVVTLEDVSKIQISISQLSKEYDIHLDYFEIGNYTEEEYINAPLFFKACNENGLYKSKLVVNNASPFWTDKEYQEVILNSGYFAGNTLEDFVEHELAHVMTFQNCKTIEEYHWLETILHPMYTNGISRYSWDMKDGAETIAEAFVRMRKGKKVNENVLKLLHSYTEVWKYD